MDLFTIGKKTLIKNNVQVAVKLSKTVLCSPKVNSQSTSETTDVHTERKGRL